MLCKLSDDCLKNHLNKNVAKMLKLFEYCRDKNVTDKIKYLIIIFQAVLYLGLKLMLQ